MTETTKRIIELQNIIGIKDYSLEINAGIPISSIQAWTKGKKRKDGSFYETTPSTDSIAKLARYFNVSADYLLCLTDEPKPLENCEIQQSESFVPAILRELPDLFKEQRYINTTKIYNELPDEYRERAFGLIMGIAVGVGINVENILRR